MTDCEHEYIKKPHPVLARCDYPVCRHCGEPKHELLRAAVINELPDRVRLYIHDLETNADPAGTIQDLAAQRDNVAALQLQVVRLDAALNFFRITDQDIADALEGTPVVLGQWSKNTPAKQGWYWYRKSDAYHAVPTFVEDCGNSRFRAVEVYDQMSVWVNNVDVEWWPIPILVPHG